MTFAGTVALILTFTSADKETSECELHERERDWASAMFDPITRLGGAFSPISPPVRCAGGGPKVCDILMSYRG